MTLTDLDLFGRQLPLHASVKPMRRSCPVCGLATLRAVDAPHRLCDGCAGDTATAMAIVEAHLVRITRETDAAHEAWTAFLATLDDATALRWNALTQVRDKARADLNRARTARRRTGDDARYQAHLATVEAAWAKVQGKIERTKGDHGNPLTPILEREAAHLAALAQLTRDMQRWEMARSDVEIAAGDEVPL